MLSAASFVPRLLAASRVGALASPLERVLGGSVYGSGFGIGSPLLAGRQFFGPTIGFEGMDHFGRIPSVHEQGMIGGISPYGSPLSTIYNSTYGLGSVVPFGCSPFESGIASQHPLVKEAILNRLPLIGSPFFNESMISYLPEETGLLMNQFPLNCYNTYSPLTEGFGLHRYGTSILNELSQPFETQLLLQNIARKHLIAKEIEKEEILRDVLCRPHWQDPVVNSVIGHLLRRGDNKFRLQDVKTVEWPVDTIRNIHSLRVHPWAFQRYGPF